MSRVAELVIEDFKRALDRRDHDGLADIGETLAEMIETRDATLDNATAEGLLKRLRSQRQFDRIDRLARAIDTAGSATPLTRRTHAQALIDTGRLDEAVQVLDLELARPPFDGEDFAEACGLMGRTWKQRYIDGVNANPPVTDAAALKMAISYYATTTKRGNLAADHWHTINFAALTARAERDGIASGHTLPSKAIAAALRDVLEPTVPGTGTPGNAWAIASLAEAYVAMGDLATARARYTQYTASTGYDAFEIFSSRRQLIEVWQLKRDDGDAGAILKLLDDKLRDLLQADTTFARSDVERLQRMERLAGPEAAATADASPEQRAQTCMLKTLPVQHILLMAKRIFAVGQLFLRRDSAPVAAGFIVRSHDLNPQFGHGLCLISNSHAVGTLSRGYKPHEIKFLTSYDMATPMLFDAGDVLWESPVHLLDAVVLRIKSPPAGIEPLPLCSATDLPADFQLMRPDQRWCHFIGPAQSLQPCATVEPFSILDLGWLDSTRPDHVYFHHEMSTRDGSSGSALLNIDWQVIGIHRAGTAPNSELPALGGRVGGRVARMGVSINAIRQQIAVDLGASRSQPSAAPALAAAPLATTGIAAARPLTYADVAAKAERGDLDRDTIERVFEIDHGGSDPLPLDVPMKPRPPADGAAPELYMGDVAWDGAAHVGSLGFRSYRNRGFRQRKAPETGLTLISDGDSWFQYPIPGISDTIDHLKKRHAVYCLAVAGSTLAAWAANAHVRILKTMQDFESDAVVLSGGGNDLLGFNGISNFVARFRAGATAEDLIQPELDKNIDVLVGIYGNLIGEIFQANRSVKVFAHGYDYAMPEPPSGRWICRPLKEGRGIESLELQARIIRILIDRFNVQLATLETKFPGRFYFVDCRRAVGTARKFWHNELHPRTEGFGRVADRFNQRFEVAFPGDPRLKPAAARA